MTDHPVMKIMKSGCKVWCLNEQIHREDGPAIIRPDGGKQWFINGKTHREDGPAVEDLHGINYWFYNDTLMTFDEWCKASNQTEEEILCLMLKYF